MPKCGFGFLQRHLVSPSNWGRGRYGSYYSFADSMTARAPREMEGSFAETDEVEKETNWNGTSRLHAVCEYPFKEVFSQYSTSQ